MTYSVYQHWDPLKVCIVGRSYPPEFYSWISVPHVRELFERIATETEEDYQNIIGKLQSFGVNEMRPDIPEINFCNDRWMPPPMTPRDTMVMIGTTFYENYSLDLVRSYQNIADPSWPPVSTWQDYHTLPDWIKTECNDQHGWSTYHRIFSAYSAIFDHVRSQGNSIKCHWHPDTVNGAMVSRIGRDLYFGPGPDEKDKNSKVDIDQEFPTYRTHTVHTGGHSDGTYCPVAPGLIISLHDVPTYADTFPGWEVVYLPGQSWEAVKPFLELKAKNQGKWWIPGFEHDQSVIDVVETWLSHWTGYVEETVFDVNMFIIDPKNVMVFNHNEQVFDALDRYGITPHVIPFRHRYFWDGGIHCITTDLHREGTMQDWFPSRS